MQRPIIIVCAFFLACSTQNSTDVSKEPETNKSLPENFSDTPSLLLNKTPNDFLQQSPLTFILGTAGNELENKSIETQVALVRSLFPGAKVIKDISIDLSKGVSAWPEKPVIYGGAHVNHLIDQIDLPFQIETDKIEIGEQVFQGEEYRLITVIPANKGAKVPYPAFLLYAGTGRFGVAEINSVSHGQKPILVADSFGRLVTGEWKQTKTGNIIANISSQKAPRIEWRTVTPELSRFPIHNDSKVHVLFPKKLSKSDKEEQILDICLTGITKVVEILQITEPISLNIYMYPDRGSKKSLTGNPGDGHAVPSSDTLHIVYSSTIEDKNFESLITHESTHILAYKFWGPVGTSLLGEGLAVWLSGQYGEVTLHEWKSKLNKKVTVSTLLKEFRKLPEQESYPLAGILVETLIKNFGIDNMRKHFLGATTATWETVFQNAGTSLEEVEKVFQAQLKSKK